MQMFPVLKRLPVSPPTDCSGPSRRNKRRRNRRNLFSLKKYYYCGPDFVTTAPFYGWEEDSNNCSGFTQTEIHMSQAHFNFMRHQLHFPIRRITSVSPKNTLEYVFMVQEMPPIPALRVLSLCDGISTPLVVLEETLQLSIEYYFSSEVDQDCRSVQQKHYKNHFIQLGCVQSLAQNKDLLMAILPIHLVMLSPPCLDLTLLNARRFEWQPNSSAHLITDCMNIVKFITRQQYQFGCGPIWLFETTAHMSVASAKRVRKEVGAKLHPICASAFTATYRRRFFAGNLPQLGDTAARVNKSYSGVPLQSFLEGYRIANTVIAPCITSNTSLQKKPVCSEGCPDNLYISEIESLMGFPQGYTDAANLSIKRREKLLARALNVPTLHALLAPLSDLFRSALKVK